MITQKLLRDVFAPRKGEQLTILTDGFAEQKPLIDTLARIFTEMGFPPTMISYPPTGQNSAPFPPNATQDGRQIDFKAFIENLGKKDIVIAITRFSASGPLFPRLTQKFRGATMPGATLEMSGFDADYKKLRQKTQKLRDLLNKADLARAEFSTGHHLTFDLRIHRAKADDGDCTKPGKGINFPSGEAYIVPYEGSDSLTEGDWPVAFGDETAILQVKANKVINVVGDGPHAKEMRSSFIEFPARCNIAELGLGTNDAAAIIGSILQDEKAGPHIAYGLSSHLGGTVTPEMFLPGKAIHEDKVYAKGCRIMVQNLTLKIKGKDIPIIEGAKYV